MPQDSCITTEPLKRGCTLARGLLPLHLGARDPQGLPRAGVVIPRGCRSWLQRKPLESRPPAPTEHQGTKVIGGRLPEVSLPWDLGPQACILSVSVPMTMDEGHPTPLPSRAGRKNPTLGRFSQPLSAHQAAPCQHELSHSTGLGFAFLLKGQRRETQPVPHVQPLRPQGETHPAPGCHLPVLLAGKTAM